MENNENVEKERYDEKHKSVEAVATPITTKMYQSGDSTGMHRGTPGGTSGGKPDSLPGRWCFRYGRSCKKIGVVDVLAQFNLRE